MEKQLRVMVVGAHPDDCDFNYGGIALQYAALGHKVKFLSLCNGCYGHHVMTPEQTAARRYLETQASANVAGIEYDVWDVNDCELEASLENRKRLIRDIRTFQPDILFSHRPNDYHADHRNASILVQDASYLLIVPGFCPEVPAMRKMPTILYCWDRFQQPPFRADVVVGIDKVIDKKFEMMHCHESQVYEWLPYSHCQDHTVPQDKSQRLEWLHGEKIDRDADPDDSYILSATFPGHTELDEAWLASTYRKELIQRYGEAGHHIHFAEAFGGCEYGTPLTKERIDELFPF